MTDNALVFPRQRTLRSAIGCVGVGIHTGSRIALTMRPAPADSGIRFVRENRPRREPIRAAVSSIADTTRCTQLRGPDGSTVSTVEHLMAALAAWGIDNVEIALDGPEVPAMDGSAQPFFFLIGCAGIVEQDEPRRLIEVVRPVTVGEGPRAAALLPYDGFALDVTIAFTHPMIGVQRIELDVDATSFANELAAARTFGFAEDVERLRAQGLARGGSLDNAVVVAADGVLNPDGLRWPDEFVRHKALDALGDLYIGGPILGRFVGRGGGHALHATLLRKLLANPVAWRRVEPAMFADDMLAPTQAAQLGAD